MKRFSFPLDSVLVWRRLELEREEALLQRMLTERNALAAREAAARAQRLDAERLISGETTISAEFVSTLPQWQGLMKKSIAAMAGELAAADRTTGEQRVRFQAAKLRVELLERLREKRFTDWSAALGREEEAFAAEMFLARSIGLGRSGRRGQGRPDCSHPVD